MPHTPEPKQAAFLLLPQIEALFGGQAGGGKSDALLMAALQYVDVPGYAALLLRRTYQDLTLPEALMDRAHEWLADTDARWNGTTYTWTFPGGATLTFGYLDKIGSEYRYQSSAYQYIAFDELTQFTEPQYRYLFSRLRRLEGSRMPIRMRSATNPGGIGHEWVKARFVKPRNPERPFIPAALADNPHVDRDEYMRALGLLTSLQRAWYERGDWEARPAGALASRAWFPIVDAVPAEARWVRFWDFAATAPAKGRDPDWTVGTLMAEADHTWYVQHVVRGRWGPGEVQRVVRQTAEADGKTTAVVLEQEPGSSGKLFAADMVKALAGFAVRPVPSTGDKVTRAMPFLAQAEAGNVRLLSGAWIPDWLDEICSVPDAPHDDQWDSAAAAFAALQSSTVRLR